MAINRRVPLQHPTTTTSARCRRLNHDWHSTTSCRSRHLCASAPDGHAWPLPPASWLKTNSVGEKSCGTCRAMAAVRVHSYAEESALALE